MKEVENWKELANQLGFLQRDVKSINQNCAKESEPATCCRNRLVDKQCMSKESHEEAVKELIKALNETGYVYLGKCLQEEFFPQSGKIYTP